MNRITINFLFYLVFILFTKLSFAYEAPIPAILYCTSENKQYLLEILPIIEISVGKIDAGISRNKLIIITYKKESRRFSDIESPIISWEEVSFFRAYHNDGSNNPAEVSRALISNSGKNIVIESRLHPWLMQDTDILFLYDQQGKLIKKITTKEIYLEENNGGNKDKPFTTIRKDYNLYIDNDRGQLIISYDGKKSFVYDLMNGKKISKNK